MKLSDLNILDIGNTIQISGLVLQGQDQTLLAPFPGEVITLTDASHGFNRNGVPTACMDVLQFTTEDWERFFQQSDWLEVECQLGERKVVLRKSQRQIDAAVSWAVFKRDDYRCRYCGKEGPLTIDHILTWESGGPTIQQNLLAADRRCNRTRGNMLYAEWIHSDHYRKISKDLNSHVRAMNETLIDKLPELEKLKVSHVRSR